MEFGPDGSLYILEYGKDYFMKNAEARLVRITYAAGNRSPVPAIEVDRSAGGIPHPIHVSANHSYDLDEKDSLRFEWSFVDSTRTDATGPEATFTYTQAGTFEVVLRVYDRAGSRSVTRQLIQVGNAPPEVAIRYTGNQSFFFDTGNESYEIQVSDSEDQAAGTFDPGKVSVVWLHADHPEDAEVLLGGQQAGDHAASLKYLKGLQLIQGSDCMSCHALSYTSAGPSYVDVARRYQGQPGAAAALVSKIYLGGNGNWGEKMMPGHPQHTREEISEMVSYILSLASERSLPAKGPLRAAMAGPYTPGSAFLLAATYTDQGAQGLPSQSTRQSLLLRHPRIQAEAHQGAQGLELYTLGKDRDIATMASHGDSWLKITNIDMSGISGVTAALGPFGGGVLLFRLDSLEGPVIGQMQVAPGPEQELKGFEVAWRQQRIPLQASEGRHDLYVVFKGRPGKLMTALDWMQFEGK
ncbi:MAG: PKD domain-containing protein [Bacteroidetes bacterium]|nr:MAG: PKD domain-containing protein [Bacteroidota bacterium]